MTARGLSLEERFFLKVDRTDTCWIWTGCRSPKGYGEFSIPRHTRAHRWSYEHFVGPIPDGLTIDHLCCVTSCVNPEHLEPVTSAENSRRRRDRRSTTHCYNGHEYAVVGMRTYSDGHAPACRACARDAVRRYAARRAA